MSNEKYGRIITDEQFINRTIESAQDKIDKMHEEDWGVDGIKDVIIDYLDELYIYPQDIDFIFSELEF